ncbi:MAG: POTRA domain-containing protein [Planctomycetaceae bacterium]
MPNSQTLIQRIRRLFCEWHCSSILAAATFFTSFAGGAAVTFAQQESDSEGVMVADIRIEGNETIPESVILQKVQSQPQRPITERLIREDKRSLMSTRWFFSVTERLDETPDGLILVFTVHERPIVQRVQFIINREPTILNKMNLSAVKEKHLKAWTGLKAGSPFDHVANQEAVRRIEQEYHDKGYYFVKVELVKGGKPGEREVVFRITEGPKVQVKERTFEGNRFWDDGDLRKNLISKEAFLVFGGLYNPDTLPSDIEAVKQYYRGVGFFDVEVTGVPMFSDDKSDVNLHFTVKEGRRYTVREIRFQGNSIIATNKLKGDSKLKAGEKFNSYPLSKDVNRMLGYYGEMGHYFASVNPVPQFTEQEGVVDLVFEIDEDRPRYVRDVNVTYDGDYPHTKQTVVLDRIQVQPGDIANPKLIRRGRSRLNGSGLFEPGIAFEVTPVEPEQSSFAQTAVSRTWRGQSPANAPDDWTQQFAIETQRSAFESTEIGSEWSDIIFADPLRDEIVAVENESISTDSVEYAHGTEASRDRVASNGNMEYVSSRPGLSSEAAAPDVSMETGFGSGTVHSLFSNDGSSSFDVQPMTSPFVPAVGHSFGRKSNLPVEAQPSEHKTARPVFESDLMGFRSAEPVSLFSLEVPTFVASQCIEETEAPIIRAQSPEDSQRPPVDPATPGYRDPILEGSPYRNQFQAIPPGWVDINVNAAEGRTGRLMFGAGVNSDAGVVGSFVWDESNFDLFRPPTSFADIIEGRAWRGGGQRFRAEAAPGNQVSRYAISWTDPYFMYTDYSFGVSGFYFNRFYPDWREDRVGGRISLGRQWTPEWSSGLALRLEEVDLKNPTTPTPPIIAKDLGSSFLSTVRANLTHDTRDQSVMPSEGHYADIAYEQAFNEFTYPRAEAEFRQYFTLYNRPDGSGRQVLTVAGNIGWSGDDTPVFERYFAGGFQSFRGFSYRGVTPRVGNVGVGGTFQALGTVEYRVPVTADDMINVVAFTDFGTVEQEVTLDNFRATAGFGVRVVIPAMGPVPLAFDFAFPIKSQASDDERVFSFYVGINR